jgi:hypothetical protein
MRTIIKLCICVFIVFSFTACYPFMMVHREGGQGRYYYNNHNYNSGREYRQARRQDRGHERNNNDNYDNHRESR